MPPPRHINLDQQAQLQSCTTDIIADGAITNAKLSASADIAFDKLAPLPSGNILIGDASNNATSINPTGDIDISNTGVFSINSNVIVDDDINVLAAISTSKLADASNFLLRNTSNILTDNIRFTYTTNQTFTDPNDLVTKSYVDSVIVPGPSSSQWTTSGSDIYFNSGNVGIGATVPATKLHVAGNIQSDGYIYSGGDYVAPCAVLDSTSGLYIELSNGTTFQSYSQSVEISSPVFDFVQYRLTNSFTTSKSYDLRLHPTTKAFQIAENAFNVRFQILSSGAAVIHPGGVPSSTSSVGETGQLSFDANFFYVCTATNTWKRAALSTW
jgi:hypothetical protein